MFCEACGYEVEEQDAFCAKCGQPLKGEARRRSPRICTREREGRVVAGVCAGWASYLGKDVTLIRILCVVLALVPPFFPGATAYIVSWMLMPAVDSKTPTNTPQENVVATE